MEWLMPLTNIFAAMVGGLLVIFGDRLRQRQESKDKQGDSIVRLYTDFFVHFQLALHHNESFWSGVRWELEGRGAFKETERGKEGRYRADIAFREAAWRVRLRETDREQQDSIEKLARAFDDEIEDTGDYQVTAMEYDQHAKQLRSDASAVIDRMQRTHKRTLKLF